MPRDLLTEKPLRSCDVITLSTSWRTDPTARQAELKNSWWNQTLHKPETTFKLLCFITLYHFIKINKPKETMIHDQVLYRQ